MTRTYGPATVSVQDDTAAFQRAIDSLPADGGTVIVPAGRYMIDAVKSVRLRSNMRLLMESGTTLEAIPNNAARSNVLLLDGLTDVDIRGGWIIGERNGHVSSGTGTDEWGHGIKVTKCSRITIAEVSVTKCNGDGLSINGNDIELLDVVSRYNRRQALTIGACDGVLVERCTLSDTGNWLASIGTKPMAGIDIEPDKPGQARNIVIRNSTISHNTGDGVLADARPAANGIAAAVVEGVQIIGCTIENNVNGVEMLRVRKVNVSGNTITGQNYSGVRTGPECAEVEISGNTFYQNSDRGGIGSLRAAEQILTGTSKETAKDILISYPGATIVVGTNKYA